jgi:enamine deaminase RidA (YjgF/YER057c/UK114 family)
LKIEQRIQEIYGELPVAPMPIASYVPIVQCGNILYLSGQGPIINGKQIYTGLVGETCTLVDGYEAAKLCGINLLAQLKKYLGDLDRVNRIVNARIYVASSRDFVDQPKVANGLSELMVEVFGEIGRHSRCALGIKNLPGNIPVEAEIIVEIKM